jgi:putative toxin-antitoxin system antitoxin component (TIGR02293 family)
MLLDDEGTMTTLTAVFDHLHGGAVVATAHVARVREPNPRSVSRWRADAAVPRREAEERLLKLRVVVDLTRQVMRDSAARLWLRSPNPDLGYEKPLDLIAQGHYKCVIDLLLAIAEGVTARDGLVQSGPAGELRRHTAFSSRLPKSGQRFRPAQW